MASGRNQGEGDKRSARKYNKSAKEFTRSGNVEKSAEAAERALEGEEKTELERAEQTGKQKAKEFDPQVKRDYRSSR